MRFTKLHLHANVKKKTKSSFSQTLVVFPKLYRIKKKKGGGGTSVFPKPSWIKKKAAQFFPNFPG